MNQIVCRAPARPNGSCSCKRLQPSRLAFLLVIASVCRGQAPAVGTAPSATLGARDIVAEFRLPRLKDGVGDDLLKAAGAAQVMRRATRLKLNLHSATEAWIASASVLARAHLVVMDEPAAEKSAVFRGARASELNAFLTEHRSGSVLVVSREIVVDAPIRLGGKKISLDLGRALIKAQGPEPYAVRIENSQDVKLMNGVFTAGNWGLLISGSQRVTVLRTRMQGLAGGGIVVTHSDDVVIWGSTFQQLGAAAVMLHGASDRAVVAENDISRNVGNSNWHAGVVLSDRNADLAADPLSMLNPDRFGVKEQLINDRLRVPRDNLIAFNRILENQSSGIYSDGAARTVIYGNRVERNAKEGLCLDNGSTANVVAYNLVEANGKRWGKTDEDLKRDFVMGFGRMPDGSSRAKVPGISLDNAAYNHVMFNQVNGNFGGGIKLVRTSYYNAIGLNTLTNNNAGQSETFHFFGIELGAAKADTPVPDLDFTASRGNQIFKNYISGTHYAGIFFSEGSDQNDVFDNAIFGAESWALESVRVQGNMTLNNLTNQRSRNIQAGLDPGLLTISAGKLDQR